MTYDQAFGGKVRDLIYNDVKTTLEYKVTFDAAGKVASYYGPENHVPKEVIEKMKLIQKFKLLRSIF